MQSTEASAQVRHFSVSVGGSRGGGGDAHQARLRRPLAAISRVRAAWNIHCGHCGAPREGGCASEFRYQLHTGQVSIAVRAGMAHHLGCHNYPRSHRARGRAERAEQGVLAGRSTTPALCESAQPRVRVLGRGVQALRGGGRGGRHRHPVHHGRHSGADKRPRAAGRPGQDGARAGVPVQQRGGLLARGHLLRQLGGSRDRVPWDWDRPGPRCARQRARPAIGCAGFACFGHCLLPRV
mmetsp:Transcript_16758/g.37190  ORF Transcript_16758/g.37190 Transcript_16758/m.37190 type:complete len:238 (-) Transcript_16758:890-1603(-)